MKTQTTRKRLDIIILVAVIIITALAASQITKLKIDSSIDVFIPKNNPTRKIDNIIRQEFGGSDTILLGMESKFNSILEPENLVIIDEITRKLEELPEIDNVISLTNIEYLDSSTEGMEVSPLMEGVSEEELSLFKQRLNDWSEMYYGTAISDDMSLAAILIQPKKDSTEDDGIAIYAYMQSLSKEYTDLNLSFPMAGKPVIKKEISRSVFRDVIFLVPIVAFLIILVLFFSFRKPTGVIFPLLSLIVSCIWVMGLMGYLGLTFSMASILIPVLLLVVGSAYGIHIMAHFYEALEAEDEILDFDKLSNLIENEARKIRTSVILAGVTTAAGFVSQISSPLTPFKLFGIMSAAGIFISLLLTFLLIPAMIRLRYPSGLDPVKLRRKKKHLDKSSENSIPGVFILMEKMAKKGVLAAILLSIIIFGTTFLLIPKITIGTNLIDFFTPDSRMVRDTDIFNEKLNGTGVISLVIQSPERGGVITPAFLKKVEIFEQWLPDTVKQVTKVQSIVPGIKRLNRIMNHGREPFEMTAEEEPVMDFFSDGGLWGDEDSFVENTLVYEETGRQPLTYNDAASLIKTALNKSGARPSAQDLTAAFLALENFEGEAFDEIPEDPQKYGLSSMEELENLISQYMILYSGSLNMMLNDPLEPDRTLITIQLNKEASRDVREAKTEIESFWDYYLQEDWTYEIAGNSTFNVVLADLVVKSQLISLGIALIIVWLILVILFRSIKTGTIGMIPVFFALAGIFSFMVMLGFSLDIVTSLIAALAVGIGVDYAIHFITSYHRELSLGSKRPLIAVYKTTGRAILFNASSVALGFLGLLFSRFIPIRQLGILFTTAMVYASMSALIILPMILSRMKDPFKNINKSKINKENKEWVEKISIA